jgi:hydrogenase expression/formation protein HypC
MCIAIPSKVIAVRDQVATVECYGVQREASLLLMDDVAVGDYVIVQTGFIIEKLDETTTEETLKLFDEVMRYQSP